MRFFINSVLFTIIHQSHCLVESPYLLLLQSSDTNTVILVISQFEILSVFVEQIVYAFVIYFQIRDPNFEMVRIHISFNTLEDISDCTWEKAR